MNTEKRIKGVLQHYKQGLMTAEEALQDIETIMAETAVAE